MFRDGGNFFKHGEKLASSLCKHPSGLCFPKQLMVSRFGTSNGIESSIIPLHLAKYIEFLKMSLYFIELLFIVIFVADWPAEVFSL